jgi:hypothetical protein
MRADRLLAELHLAAAPCAAKHQDSVNR